MEVEPLFGLTYLKLPPLPLSLQDAIVSASDRVLPDEAGRQWIENFHQNQINAVSHVYGKGTAILSDSIQQQINELYSPYFGENVVGLIGKLENTQHYSSACWPPHCDRYRNVAVNYLLQAGGKDVITCFYKQHRGDLDLTEAANIRYENIDLDVSICIAEKVWHCYSVQYYHSIENIQNSRLLFSMILESNPTSTVFKNKYTTLFN